MTTTEVINFDPKDSRTRNSHIDNLTDIFLRPREILIENHSQQSGNDSITNITRRYPRLVLAVIGDSSSFVPKPWLSQSFQLGLIETAKGARDCVILYKGSNEKVSSLVWEAVDDFSVMNNCDKNENNSNFISLVGIRPEEDGKTHAHDKHSVKERYFNLRHSSNDWHVKDYGKFHAEILENISKKYVPFVELGEGLSKIKLM